MFIYKQTEFSLEELYEQAQEGDAQAQFLYAACHLEGKDGLVVDIASAIHWLEKSADQAYVDAQFMLGIVYYNDQFHTPDYEKARFYLTMPAMKNMPDAQYILGMINNKGGYGVITNAKQALLWLEKAAHQGLAQAMTELGLLYLKGNEDIAQNHELAFKWLSQSANRQDAKAMYYLSQMYELGIGVTQDEKKAFDLCMQSANKGFAIAQNSLGSFYQMGKGGQAINNELALRWFHLAADNANVIAHYNLAQMYDEKGYQPNSKKALVYYRKAAEFGFAPAQYQMGIIYHYGLGVRINDKKAFGFFNKAAKAGMAQAMYMLGYVYENGLGVTVNLNKAKAWYMQSYDIEQTRQVDVALKRVNNKIKIALIRDKK